MKITYYGYLFFLATCIISLAAWTGFAIGNNDFLQLLKLAEYTSIHDISSLYNGIYPAAFVLLLKAITEIHLAVSPTMIAIQAISFIGLGIIAHRHSLGLTHSAMYIWPLFLLLDTHLFQYFITPGAYIPFVALSSMGLLSLGYAVQWDVSKSWTQGLFFLAFACLFRAHGILLLSMILFLAIAFQIKKKWILRLLSVWLLLLLWSALVSFWAGAYSMHSEHRILVRNVDWHAIYPGIQLPQMDVRQFAQFYLNHFWMHLFYLLSFVLYLFLDRNSSGARFIASIAIVYYIIIHGHPSSRGILLLIPLSFYYYFLLLYHPVLVARFQNLSRHSRSLLLAVILIIVARIVMGGKWETLSAYKNTNHSYTQIDQFLHQLNPSLRAEQVFTPSFDFYLPRSLPSVPYTVGGWSRLNKHTYTKYPNPNMANQDTLLSDLHRLGIQCIVIDRPVLRDQISSYSTLRALDSLLHSENLLQRNYPNERFEIYTLAGK